MKWADKISWVWCFVSYLINFIIPKINMDAGDHVNTQLLIIIVIREKLSDYSNVILEVQLYY